MATTTRLQPAPRLNRAAAPRRPDHVGTAPAVLAALCAATLAVLPLPLAAQTQPSLTDKLLATVPGLGRAAPPPAAPPASAPVVRAPRSPARPAVGCLISPERVADIGSPVTGVVAQVVVERGARVGKGQVLVQLEREVETAGVQAAEARASVDADIQAAQATYVLALQRHQRLVGLVGQGFVSQQAIDQARAERNVAEQKLAQAKAQQAIQSRELGVVRAQLGLRTVRSPFAGVVVDRFVNDGERVEEKPLLRLAQVNPLRVELVLPATRWGSVREGDAIGVLPELPGATSAVARVTHVDSVLDPASNTFVVRLQLPNPDFKLPAGARCKADLPPPGAAVAAAPAASAPAAPAPAKPTPAKALPASATPARPAPAQTLRTSVKAEAHATTAPAL